jgi:hypothetical protein
LSRAQLKDSLYTNSIISKAKAHKCIICDKYFTESEANNKDFHYSKTRHGSEVFVHKSCFREG